MRKARWREHGVDDDADEVRMYVSCVSMQAPLTRDAVVMCPMIGCSSALSMCIVLGERRGLRRLDPQPKAARISESRAAVLARRCGARFHHARSVRPAGSIVDWNDDARSSGGALPTPKPRTVRNYAWSKIPLTARDEC